MEKGKALFIGLTTVDIQYFVEQFPKPNEKVKGEPPYIHVGGPAANASITCEALNTNIEVDFLTCVGNNEFTFFVSSDFRRNGVSVIDAMFGKENQPIIATVITDTTTSSRSILTHHPEEVDIHPDVLPSINVADYTIIFTDGFYPELAIPICKLAKSYNIPVVFDGGSWKPYLNELLPWIDYAICSADFKPPGITDSNGVFDFLQSFRIEFCAISQGENNIQWQNKSTRGEVEIQATKAIDSLGAGDVLHGAFVHYLLLGFGIEESLKEASIVASFSTKHRGTRSWIESFRKLCSF